MKRLVCLLITALLLSSIPEIVSAQANDPFEQQVPQSKGGKNEKRNKNRRKVETQEVTEAPAPAPQQDVKQPVSEMTISNPCSDWLDFELVSMVGSTGTQEVSFTIKFTSHEMNDYMYVGGRLIAYDSDGNEHSGYGAQGFNVVTDVPVKATIKIRDRIDPRKTQVLPVVSFNIGDCRIEMRKVPIDWK